MSEYFTNNRQVIKGLAINTGTTANPTWSNLCCASDITLNVDTESDDFYIFCDYVQRHLLSGMNAQLETTLKVDAQSTGVTGILTRVESALTSGSLATLENVEIKFDMLTGYSTNTLTYETYYATANMGIDALGGSAEGSAEIGVTFNINGTVSTSAPSA